ncbi:MAG: DEAD/DEAH box helicase [Gemmatimonadota bacterium]|nr:DEAD/DEAH box helicase [Gemmatimonadota bacterium]MDH4351456.1 DEAD/DEAH box helicase [Gemmatimonadota bacterium]MDH5195708.1 DEAD/DEAH box helicase [Gemmatimonadota bacterium]
MPFTALGLAPELVRALEEQQYESPTPIQKKAIPVGLAGHDVVGSAQTGTGKTAAFLLPILQRLREGPNGALRALVLVPTRELAEQVVERAQAYGKYTDVRAAPIYGGVPMEPQIRALKDGVEIIVATPGRLLDHMGRGRVDTSAIEALVLDEADRMLDMGFAPDVHKILSQVPDERQTFFFSATISPEVESLARRALREYTHVAAAHKVEAADGVEQFLIAVDRAHKRHVLAHLLTQMPSGRTLVFTRTRHGADSLSRQLRRDDIDALPIHGDLTQAARQQALERFRRGKVHVLVATDVAARGIDVDDIVMVVNYDVPMDPEIYVHRVGRTARAGAQGVAVTLMSPDEWMLMWSVEKLLGRTLPRETLPGFEPSVEPLQPVLPIEAKRSQGPTLRHRRGRTRRR